MKSEKLNARKNQSEKKMQGKMKKWEEKGKGQKDLPQRARESLKVSLEMRPSNQLEYDTWPRCVPRYH